jgi:hypothetical protein
MNRNQQDQNFGMKDSFNLFYAAAKVHAYCFFPFIRRDFGSDALGLPAFLAMLLMLMVGGLGRVPDMFTYLCFWFGALIIQRTKTAELVRRGVIRHSRYEGDPWLAFCIPFVHKTSIAKGLIEPVLCLAAGAALETVSHELGVFVMAGAVSLAVVEGIHRELNRKRLTAMRDAEIEQRWLAARYRGEIDD